LQSTFFAERLASLADVSAEEDKLMMCSDQLLLGDPLHESLLHIERSLRGLRSKTDTLRYPEDVRIYRHGRCIEAYGEHYAGTLASDPCERLQALTGGGYLSVKS